MELKKFIILFALMLNVTVLAQNLPNDFQSGEIASAQEVNENFQYLLDKHNDKKVIRFNGIAYGTTEYGLITKKWFPSNIIHVMTFKNIHFQFFESLRGKIGSNYVYYKTDDCTGTPYFLEERLPFVNRPGFAWESRDLLYYAESNAQPYRFIAYSKYYGTTCATAYNPAVFVVARVNDPHATGILKYPLEFPITIDGLELQTILEE